MSCVTGFDYYYDVIISRIQWDIGQMPAARVHYNKAYVAADHNMIDGLPYFRPPSERPTGETGVDYCNDP